MPRTLSTAVRLTLAAALALAALAGTGPQPAHAQTLFPGYTSGIQVANLSPSQTAAITLNAYKADGSAGGTPLSDQIPANASKTYFPISNVEAGFSGSVVIGSNQNVAGIVNIMAIVNGQYVATAAYVGRTAGASTLRMPLLMKENGGFTTWFAVQNAGSTTTNVSVSYSDGTSAGPVEIKPGAAKVFYQSLETHGAKTFAATVTSDNDTPLVGTVLQESTKILYASTAFTGGDANPQFPLVNVNNANTRTGIQIQNIGDTATDVTLSYTPSAAGTPCTEMHTIQPGASETYTFVAFESGVPGSNCVPKEKFVGSAKVTANSANQPLVGIANQLAPAYGEAYVSFAGSDAGSTVVMPLIMDRNSGYFTGFSVQNVGDTTAEVTCTFQNSSRTFTKVLAPGAALLDLQNGQLGERYVGSAICAASEANAKLVGVVNQLGNRPGDQLSVYEAVKR